MIIKNIESGLPEKEEYEIWGLLDLTDGGTVCRMS
jgi:hypothetical protein